jgi:hypothetical protein
MRSCDDAGSENRLSLLLIMMMMILAVVVVAGEMM